MLLKRSSLLGSCVLTLASALRSPQAPSVIYSDSKSAVDLAFDPVAFKKTKHILRAAEFLRDLVQREVVTLKHVAGATMIADILTKACARMIFVALLQLIVEHALARRVCPE